MGGRGDVRMVVWRCEICINGAWNEVEAADAVCSLLDLHIKTRFCSPGRGAKRALRVSLLPTFRGRAGKRGAI